MPATRELVAPRLGTKKCGGVVYHRFSTPVAELLAEGGHWIISRRRGSTALCLPDNGSLPRVTMQVPALAELLRFAAEVHQRREPYEGSMWGWPVRYTPGAFGHVVTDEECPRLARPTRFEIGVPGLWRAVAEWTNDEPVVWVEDTSANVAPV